jgi:NAD(P)-dependent dehydrogenase (short-subunit alcohol dehydrogenase family)
MTMNLGNRTLFITGASRGIGLAIAVRAARDGANIAVAAKTDTPHPKLPGTIHTAAEAIEAAGGKALPLTVDVRDEEAVKGALAKTAETFGGIDIVVNNAATALTQPLGEFTLDAWNKSYDVNLRGPVFLVQYALPYLTESEHAAVVNVISAGAFLASSAQSMYSGAKAALMAFTRAQAREWAPLGIRVNALAPGTIDTDMVRNNPPDAQARMAAASPMNRAAHPDEMIGPVMFLVSDAGSFMTGQVVLADGGMVPH